MPYDERELMREATERLLRQDPQLAALAPNVAELRERPELAEPVARVRERLGSTLESRGAPADDMALETIVNRVGRPVLKIANDDYEISGPESLVWQNRLGNETVRATLKRLIPAVGRIEVDNHELAWLGTGYLVAEDVLVTNRHVAEEFCAASGSRFMFRRGVGGNGRMSARIDFREELGQTDPREFRIVDILHIEPDDGPDMAFFKVERQSAAGRLTAPLVLARRGAEALQYVATVGYPAADSRIPDQDLVRKIFGDVYDVKRLAPGQVKQADEDLVRHDCSTLGGNSGSPIIDLETGEVVGLHFSGLYLKENRGVPAALVAERLEKIRRGAGGRVSGRPGDSERPPATNADEPQGGSVSAVITMPQLTAPGATGPVDGTATWTIPVHISVALGAPTLARIQGVTSGQATGTNVVAAGSATLAEAIAETRRRLGQRDDVVAVREGFAFRGGWITQDPAVVVLLTSPEAAERARGDAATVLGFPVEFRAAGPLDYVEARGGLRDTLERVPRTSYRKPADFALQEVEQEMTVLCSVSPDGGWTAVRDFLADTRTRLTIGIYDFTAPHVIDAMFGAVARPSRRLAMVMQKKAALGGGVKKFDRDEEETVRRLENELGERFEFAWASVGKDRQFASSYHIKVIVRDGKAFWMSSGNLQTSNQPDLDVAADEPSWKRLMTYNREWHIVIDNADLAKQFEQYLRYDLKNAAADADREAVMPALEFLIDEGELLEERAPSGAPTYFAPKKFKKKVRVQPLLTPDNYQEHVLKLIRGAKKQILFQNQSFNLLREGDNEPGFEEMVEALLKKQRQGVDVRVIMRGEFDVETPLERMQQRGFDMSRVRLQNRCHTKGIVVDSKRVLVGSHNFTNQGTIANRDASLIFFDADIAEYFQDVFWFDWKKLARPSVAGRPRVRLGDGRETPARMQRASLQELLA